MSDASFTYRGSKKRKTVLTAFVLLMTVFAGGMVLSVFADADADSAIGGTDLRFEVVDEDEGTCRVIGLINPEQKGGLTIPGTVTMGDKEYTVIEIGDYAFENCEGLTSAIIPDTVTVIGNYAFNWCRGLKSVTISDSVKIIGSYAFNRCNGLSSLTIPDTVGSIGDHALQYCTGLTSLIIPAGITEISESMFSYCGGLTTITVPGNITVIKNSAFGGCWNLEEIKVASDNMYFISDRGVLLDIGKTTLIRCPSGFAGTYDIPSTVNNLKDSVFSNCTDLTDVTIPNNITTIPYSAFRGSGLTSVVLPDNLKTIGDYAFSSCGGLTTITIPSGVRVIGDSAFNTCEKLTTVMLSADLTTIGDYAFSDCFELTAIMIPDEVESIGKNAFYNCVELTTVTLPASVNDLGEAVFIYCEKLTEIKVASDSLYFSSDRGVLLNKDKTVLVEGPGGFTGPYVVPHTVTEILRSAFYECTGLTTVTFPDGLETIGDSAFGGCRELTSVIIPKGVTTIGSNVFNGCDAMAAIDVSPDNPNYSSDGYVLFNKNKTILIRTPGGFTGPYIIPDSVTRISNNAFNGCAGLTTVTIPSSISAIGNNIFYNCTRLMTVTIPSSVTSIGNEVFYNTALRVLAVPVAASMANLPPCPVIWYSGVDVATAVMNDDKTDVLVQLPTGRAINTATAGTTPGGSDIVTSVTAGTVTMDIGDNDDVYLAMTLTVPYIEITDQPADARIEAGSKASFSIKAVIVSTGTPAYRWEYSTDGVIWTVIDGAVSSEYTTADTTTEMDGRSYRCVISCDGADSKTSNPAKLTVFTETPDNTMLYIAVAAIAMIAVIALVYFFVIRD